MLRRLFFLILGLSLFSMSFTALEAILWDLQEENYVIKFECSKAKGTIGGLKGDILFDEKNLPASNFKVSVDANTLKLGLFMKNSHAKSKDFFNVKEYPTITFESKKVEQLVEGFSTTGMLTIKGKSKEVVIDFIFSEDGRNGNFEGVFKVNLEDFDLANRGVEGEVKIDLRIPVTKKE